MSIAPRFGIVIAASVIAETIEAKYNFLFDSSQSPRTISKTEKIVNINSGFGIKLGRKPIQFVGFMKEEIAA